MNNRITDDILITDGRLGEAMSNDDLEELTKGQGLVYFTVLSWVSGRDSCGTHVRRERLSMCCLQDDQILSSYKAQMVNATLDKGWNTINQTQYVD